MVTFEFVEKMQNMCGNDGFIYIIPKMNNFKNDKKSIRFSNLNCRLHNNILSLYEGTQTKIHIHQIDFIDIKEIKLTVLGSKILHNRTYSFEIIYNNHIIILNIKG